MEIALVTQYFWPEQFIINDLVKELVQLGHKVHIFTGKPNYPSGEIFSGYTAQQEMIEEYIPGVFIYRAPLRPRGKGGAKNLILNYLSFVYNGLKYFPRAISDHNIDVILVFSLSPITASIPAIKLKKQTKAHLVLWVQDLWPDSLMATGYIKNRFLLWLVKCMVKWIYFSSDTILLQSRGFVEQVKKLTRNDKLFYYPNSYLLTQEKAPGLLLSQDVIDILENYKCFIFAGNLGTVQALDTLIDAAKQLKHLDRFKLVLVGNGSKKSYLKKRIEQEKIDTVFIAGHYPISLMSEFFNRATALIVSLTDAQIFSYTLPSKIQTYLASGRPIIASMNGEGAQVIKDAKAGLVCAAEDVNGLTECIQQLYFMSESERKQLGQFGKEYFMKHFEMKTQTQNLIQLLNQRLNNV